MVDFILNVCCSHVRVPVCSWSCLKSMLLPIYEAARKTKTQDTSNKRTMQRIRLRRQFFTSCIETYLCEKDIDEQWLENRWAITSSMSCRSVCVGCCLHMDAYTVMRKVDCAWNVWEEVVNIACKMFEVDCNLFHACFLCMYCQRKRAIISKSMRLIVTAKPVQRDADYQVRCTRGTWVLGAVGASPTSWLPCYSW